MTPKEQYEARKAARRAAWANNPAAAVDHEMLDMVDRFVVAVERIADALGKTPYE